MHFVTSLTVAEGKRLIARGLVRHLAVRRVLERGLLVVAPGTTNGYVAEELLGKRLDKATYVTGRTLPNGYNGPTCRKELADLVLKDGQPQELSLEETLAQMGPGDVFVKGANAINHERGQAGVLIGHPQGGTMGLALGRIVARRIHLLHPVGLEKSVPGDLARAAAALKESDGRGPTLWVTPGELFTEIEALRQLAEVEVMPLAAGGIGGAEGAVWLLVRGERSELEKAEEALAAVRNEPPFL